MPAVSRATGVHDAVPELEYHADKGSLSHSGAKRLLPPSTPAHFRWEQDHGRPAKAAFDVGHAAHSYVLGTGQPIVEVDAPDWRTKSAQEQRDAAHAAGHVPLLTDTHQQVQAMAAALRLHPLAADLFAPGSGLPEQSMYRTDEATGVTLRCRLDWMPHPTGERLIVADYKTAVNADPRGFGKTAASYGYHMQAAWYSDMVISLGLAPAVTFLFVVQEKTAPHLVSVVELVADAVALGRRANRRAIDTYAECTASGVWPGYDTGIPLISLPPWANADLEYQP